MDMNIGHEHSCLRTFKSTERLIAFKIEYLRDKAKLLLPVLRIQTLLIRIRFLLFNLIRIRLFGTNLDAYRFKEVMYPKMVLFYTSLIDFPCQ
jgi:hypothetical protein